MPRKIPDEQAIDEAIRLGISYTNTRVKGLSEAYDAKFMRMTSVLNSMSADMYNFIDAINEKIGIIASLSSTNGVIQAIQSLSDKIDTMNVDLNGKIDSIKQDFDNLDTQVNSISSTVLTLSNDVADIKNAMGKMITNIVPNESGGFTVHHYDGTIDSSIIVEEIDPNEIDDLIFGFDKDQDNSTS